VEADVGDHRDVPGPHHVPHLLDHRGVRPLYVLVRAYWLTAAFLLAMTMSVFASWASWHAVQDVRTAQNQACASTVNSRNDLRALLTDVVAISRNQDTRDFFNAELNQLLPSMRCEGGKPVPNR
jgi:hypothetical protein